MNIFFISSLIVFSDFVFAAAVEIEISRSENGRISWMDPHSGKIRHEWNMKKREEYMRRQPGYGYVRGTTGVVSTSPVRGTVIQTIPKSTVLKRALATAKAGAAMIARNTPLGRAVTFCSLVCPFLSEEKNGGYRFEEESGEFYASGSYTHILELKTNDEGRIGWKTIFKAPTMSGNFDFVVSNHKASLDAACRNDTHGIGAKVWGEKGYAISHTGSRDCFAEKNGDVRFWGITNLNPISKKDRVLTEERFVELMEALIDSDPNKYLPYIELEEKDYSDTKVLILDGSFAQSAPYTNPQTGQAEQATWRFSTAGAGENAQTTVSETILPRPDLKPYSQEAPLAEMLPEPKPQTDNGEDGENRQPADTESLCEKHPDILACDKQPEKQEASAPALAVPVEEIPVVFEPDGIFPDSGTCPDSVSFDVSIGGSSKTFAFEYIRVCDTASRLRGFILAMAWLVVAVLATKAIKT